MALFMNERLSMASLPTLCTSSPSSTHSPTTIRLAPHTKKTLLSLSLACNFEAFSLHFHLPLKTAAEKFGVRATAFKKRCRAIGIRHWPYRKVRSLKRSLQELNRCKEVGELNEKQSHQYTTFKKQLDKLLAPETYGIDPSGRIPQHHFEPESEGEEGEEEDTDDASYASQSPRYHVNTFADCTISPMESDKTFEFSGPSHLRSNRKQHSVFVLPSSSTLPSMSFRSANTTAAFKYPFGGYDHYLHETTLLNEQEQEEETHPLFTRRYDSSSSSITPDLEPADVQEETLFHPSEASHPYTTTTANSSTLDYSSERFFDDVFLQISPDYGCLV